MVRHYKTQRQRPYKKAIIIALIILGIATIGYGIFAFLTRNDNKSAFQKTSTGHDVNLNPPTEDEKKETEDNKDRLAADDKNSEGVPSTPSQPTTGLKTAKPFITRAEQYGGNVEVAGYAAGIFEEGGTCTATLTKGSLTVTGESKGFGDASHTNCPPIIIPGSQFTATGTWNVTLTYTSPTANGTSESRNVVIQ